MYCQYCGSPGEEGNQFCAICGAKLSEQQEVPPVGQALPPVVLQKPKSKKKIWLIVVTVVVVLGLAVGGYLYFNGANTPDEEILVEAEEDEVLTWQEQYDLGLKYLQDGDYDEAIIAFEAAIQLKPKKADAYIGLADVYIALEDYEAAVDILEEGYDEATVETEIKEKLEWVLAGIEDLQSPEEAPPTEEMDAMPPEEVPEEAIEEVPPAEEVVATPEEVPTETVVEFNGVYGSYTLSHCIDEAGNVIVSNEYFNSHYDLQCSDNFTLEDNGYYYRNEGNLNYYAGSYTADQNIVYLNGKLFVLEGNYLTSLSPYSAFDDYLFSGCNDLITDPDHAYPVYAMEPRDAINPAYLPYAPSDIQYTRLGNDPIWATASASSTLDFETKRDYRYQVANMFDNDFSTSWVEGRDGYGEGECFYIGFEMDNFNISGIALVNGYASSENFYTANARVHGATIEITTKNGNQDTFQVQFADGMMEYQYIYFEDVYEDVAVVKFTIDSVYPGSQYEDTCIAELRFT